MTPPQAATEGLSRFYDQIPLRLLRAWRGQRAQRFVARYRRELMAAPAVARARQREALRRLLVHAQDSVPLHRAHMARSGLDARMQDPYEVLAQMPVLPKATLLRQAAALTSERADFGRVVRHHSGGTTGAPVSFLQGVEDAQHKDALAEAMRQLMGLFPGQRKAWLWGAHHDLPTWSSTPWKRLVHGARIRWIERNLVLPTNDLDAARMDDYLDRLEAFRPHWMQAYPSAADVLARHALDRGREVHIPHVTLTAEPTLPAQRARIAEAFGGEVTTWYGSRETGWIAAECRGARRLHINHVGLVLETTDDGRLLITDLMNHAMPLLRYDIGDRAVLGTGRCPCGDPRPVLEHLEGRWSDVLRLPSGRLVPGLALAMRGLEGIGKGILENQVVQEDATSLDVYYVPSPSFEPADEAWLLEDTRRVTHGELEIRMHQVPALRREPNGKVRYCICKVHEQERPEA